MIKLELTIDETNGVLQALGNMPYAQVVTLVEKIKAQALPQVPVAQAPAAKESDPAFE
jgi:hypothetical protein